MRAPGAPPAPASATRRFGPVPVGPRPHPCGRRPRPSSDARRSPPRPARLPPDPDRVHGPDLPRGRHRPPAPEAAGPRAAVGSPVRVPPLPGRSRARDRCRRRRGHGSSRDGARVIRAHGVLLWLLVRRQAGELGAAVALVVFVASPLAIEWSRAALIEYLALALAIGFALAGLRWRERQGRGGSSLPWSSAALRRWSRSRPPPSGSHRSRCSASGVTTRRQRHGAGSAHGRSPSSRSSPASPGRAGRTPSRPPPTATAWLTSTALTGVESRNGGQRLEPGPVGATLSRT